MRKGGSKLTVDLLLLIIRIFNSGEVQGGFVGEDQTVLLQVLVSCKQDGVEHGLVQQEVAHPFGDDDVEFVNGQNGFLEFTLDERDSWSNTIGGFQYCVSRGEWESEMGWRVVVGRKVATRSERERRA